MDYGLSDSSGELIKMILLFFFWGVLIRDF